MNLGGLQQFVAAHPFVALAVLVALLFDFTNGFHDSANAVATVVATRVLSPLQAVTMAAFFNFVGPFVFSLQVATTVGKGIVQPKSATVAVIFAALIGAIIWDLITWYLALPTSSSHALVGGLIGAAVAAAGSRGVILPKPAEYASIAVVFAEGLAVGLILVPALWLYSRHRLPRLFLYVLGGVGSLFGLFFGLQIAAGHVLSEILLSVVIWPAIGALTGALLWVFSQQRIDLRGWYYFPLLGGFFGVTVGTLTGALKLGGLTKVVLFMFVSPVIGFFMGYFIVAIVSHIGERSSPSEVDRVSRRAQIFSSAFYALTHGTNDGQKTMGVIAVLLFTTGTLGSKFYVPTWVIIAAASAMGLGTLTGGWRIVRTMAQRITHLQPYQGFSAEMGGGAVLAAMAQAGIPVSTTHAISSAIMGVGASKRTSAVKWLTAQRIVMAWIITIPGAALGAFVAYFAVVDRGPLVYALLAAATLLALGYVLWRYQGRQGGSWVNLLQGAEADISRRRAA